MSVKRDEGYIKRLLVAEQEFWDEVLSDKNPIEEFVDDRHGDKETTISIGDLTGLTELDPSHKQLTELSPGLGNLTNLTSLSLKDYTLTALPPEIGNLTNLTRLSVQGNQLTGLPPEIG